ncbi:hypothetical protein [Streptomyces omiyaensis]|uniref:Secreted protein n=1 Tax=Streptomyces omiyaensis TaxID=68247 RepID=A0ABW7C196_9ACTN|nr:hypothetical protein [Streptomyces omiyaensis]GGY61861.1 hypothetical protein GCM10010363_49190 [Streptomyces omiyaensis]
MIKKAFALLALAAAASILGSGVASASSMHSGDLGFDPFVPIQLVEELLGEWRRD